ncbi:MAG: helix-turn-helix domain-containing protein [Hyphomicrobiales bacterium]|nr:helix-turn-helix domain-containing protein [Hyphomicrobiales bacterium]
MIRELGEHTAGLSSKHPNRRMSKNTEADWPAMIQAYARGEASVRDLCRRHGVSASALYRRLKAGGVMRRRAPPEAGLLMRLAKALEKKMSRFEESLNAGGALSTADQEREARTLSSLLRMFERISTLSERERKTEATKGTTVDADTLRAELAARLEALRRRSGD